MNRTEIKYKIGFEDGEIIKYEKNKEGTITIFFKTWNEKNLEISFYDTIRFLDKNMYDISGFFQAENSYFLREALEAMFTAVPEKHGYNHYQFLNMDGDASVEIIAGGIEIMDIDGS